MRERVTQVSLAFYDLLEAKALVAAAQREIFDFEQIATPSKNADKRNPNELRQIELQLVKSRRRLHDSESAMQSATTKLRSLLGPEWAGRDFDVKHDLDALPSLPSVS